MFREARGFSHTAKGKEMARPRTARNRSPVSKQESYKFKFSDVDWTHKISDCPAYYPTLQEFDDPFIYLQKIAPEASQFGVLPSDIMLL